MLHGDEPASKWLAALGALDKPSEEGWAIPEEFLKEFDGPRLAGEMFTAMMR